MTDEIKAAALPKAMSASPLPSPPPLGPEFVKFAMGMLDKVIDPDFLAMLSSPESLAATEAREAKQRALDWPALAQFRAANAEITDPPTLVMMGDSITAMWQLAQPQLFAGSVVNRGISGQTSPQMLLRFMADVVDLNPRRVHIMCGINDIAGNTGPSTPDDYQRNIRAMIDLAIANSIDVILASITPVTMIGWTTDADPARWVPYLNSWLKELATARGLTFIDYHSALKDETGGLADDYSSDGTHLTRAGYQVMSRVLNASVDLAS